MLIRYLYETKPNEQNGVIDLNAKKPWGCIVIDNDKIGVSFCSSKDIFNKKRAREIAIARSKENKVIEPPNGIVCVGDTIMTKRDAFYKRLEDVRRKVKKA